MGFSLNQLLSVKVIICIIIIYCIIFLYGYYIDSSTKHSQNSGYESNNYTEFAKELSADMNRYNLDQQDISKLENTILNIIQQREQAKKKTLLNKLANSCVEGAISGSIIAAPGGGAAALLGACTASIINPIVVAAKHVTCIDQN